MSRPVILCLTIFGLIMTAVGLLVYYYHYYHHSNHPSAPPPALTIQGMNVRAALLAYLALQRGCPQVTFHIPATHPRDPGVHDEPRLLAQTPFRDFKALLAEIKPKVVFVDTPPPAGTYVDAQHIRCPFTLIEKLMPQHVDLVSEHCGPLESSRENFKQNKPTY